MERKKKTWTKDVVEHLMLIYPKTKNSEICKILKVSISALKSKAYQLNLKKEFEYLYKVKHTNKIWTDEKLAILINLYPDEKNIAIAKLLDLKVTTVAGKAFKLNLRKSELYNEKFPPKSRFKKGHTPANKGTKLTPAQYKKVKKTFFKKGNVPANIKKISTITSRKDSSGRIYKWIKLDSKNWEMLHVHNWKKAYGEVPMDHIIHFIDGNSKNCKIENLKCINRIEHIGNTRNNENYIAMQITKIPGGHNKYDKDLASHIVENYPELIDLKRQQLLFNKKIKTNERTKN